MMNMTADACQMCREEGRVQELYRYESGAVWCPICDRPAADTPPDLKWWEKWFGR